MKESADSVSSGTNSEVSSGTNSEDTASNSEDTASNLEASSLEVSSLEVSNSEVSNSDDTASNSEDTVSSSDASSSDASSYVAFELSREKLKELGDIYSYPTSTSEAIERLKAASELYNSDELVEPDRAIVGIEIQKNRDVIEWSKGYCNLRDYPNEEENYFRFIIPGSSVRRLTLKEQQNSREYTEREYRFDKKDQKRIDLARNYRYNLRMFKEKQRIYLQMLKAEQRVSTYFDTYGKAAKFKYKGNVIDYHGLEVLRRAIQRFIVEFVYIQQAKSMRTPFGSTYPNNFRGIHKRIILQQNVKTWIQSEARLDRLLDNIDSGDKSFLLRGMTTYHALDTLFRISLYGETVRIDKESFYNTTPTMQELLGFPEQVGVLRITKYIRRLLLSLEEIQELDSQHRGFLMGLYEDLVGDSGAFLDEISAIQFYADREYQKLYEQRKATVKIVTTEQKILKARRTRQINKARKAKALRLKKLL